MGQVNNWDALPSVEVLPGLKRKLINGEKMMLAHFTFAPGTKLPSHSHHHEQMSCILAGEASFTIGNETVTVKSGDVCHIPPNITHSLVVGSHKLVVLDCFSPPREDFLID